MLRGMFPARSHSPIQICIIAVLLWVCLSLPVARAANCLSDPPSASEEQRLLARMSAEQLRLLVDEFAYQRKFLTHDDALSSGFAEGDRVYGVGLSAGRSFDRDAVAKWRRSFAEGRHREYVRKVAPMLGGRPLGRELAAVALNSCIRSPAWSRATGTDACKFSFSAGLRHASEGVAVVPVRLRVAGGRCAKFPANPLTVSGATIECERSGNGSVSIVLEISPGRELHELVPAMPVGKLPEEPVQEQRRSTQMEVVSLYRARDYRPLDLGRGCPTCRLYAADFRPSVPEAKIVSVALLSSSGPPDWWRCSAQYPCGVPEFSPPGDRLASGCSGESACRVWRLSESGEQGQDVVQLTFEATQAVCRNCPQGMTYAEAHERWEAKVAAVRASACREFDDPPVQQLDARKKRAR
jgi:hypothetical protein